MAPPATIDLNADLGESFGVWRLGDDEALLDVVSSANVACGFHAGDPTTLRSTVAAAAHRGVRVGAQVSYRDLAGFGRRFLDMDSADLAADVLYQLGAVDAMCRAAGTTVSYLRPHGALYHAIARDHAQASAVVEAAVAFDPELTVLAMPGAVVLDLAREAGLATATEAFVDRAYAPDGSLVPRGTTGAVLTDVDQATERILDLVSTGELTAVDGTRLPLQVDSICTHGDSPHAVAMARAVRAALTEAGHRIAPFAPAGVPTTRP